MTTLPFTLSRPLVFLDVETTSNDDKVARIVEIALIRYMPDGTETVYTTRVNPGTPIPEAATAVHGITDADVAASPTWAAIGPKILRAFCLDAGGSDLAGYNVKFDARVVTNENIRHAIDDSVPVGTEPARFLDGFRLWQILDPRSLTDAVRTWLQGREHTGAHGAMSDTAAARDVIAAQCAHPMLAGKSVTDIFTLLDPPDPNRASSDGKLIFVPGGVAFKHGKWKNTRLDEVDPGYLRWALKEDFARDSKALMESALKNRKAA